MIKITQLNKVYKSKKRKKCHALNDINLTLPDAGLVFVLGKSGSGKSTMLNLIGGLDNITSGKIEVDGNDLAKFREKDFCNYRNTHIGFIFQDYHLIDELTVYENIVLSLNLRRIEDGDKVKAALAKVDLAGYEDRYPSELSGGEQQRVAIARAIVKKPRIILADEPTGNLDTNTARSIVELLKELSGECLILIVSHNVNDANAYADRIIELKKGEIISDVTRNPDFADQVTLDGDRLVYPNGLALSDRDIELININKNANLIKRTDKFIATPENKDKANKVKIENKNLSLGKELGLSGKFLKNKAFAIAVSSFMVAVIMIIMSLAQTVISFDAGRILQEEMEKNNQDSIWLNKTVSDELQTLLAQNYRVPVGEGDVQALRDAGYEGDIYPVYNHTVSITSLASILGISNYYFTNSPYITSSFGTMIVDEAFMQEKFGDYEYAARVGDFMPYGVVITDYLADAILAMNSKYIGKSYEDVLGEYVYYGHSIPHAYINGIINTGYKERYAEVFDKIEEGEGFNVTEYAEDELFQAFVNEVYDKLGYTFTTNENYIESHKDSYLTQFFPHYKLNFNGVIDFTCEFSYVIDSKYQSNHRTSDGFIAKSAYYAITPPEIPNGAKYIRVSYNSVLDNHGYIDMEIFKKGYATLVFSDGTVASENELNKYTAMINAYDGTLREPTTGSNMKISDFIEIPDGATITKFATIATDRNAFCAFYDENHKFISSVICAPGEVLPEASIRMNQKHYNELFGTEWSDATMSAFVPHKVTLSHYRYDDVANGTPLFTKEVTIIGLLSSNDSRTMDVSEDLVELFADDAYFAHSLYLDGAEGIEAALKVADELNYEYQSIALEGIHTMTKAVDVFVPVFELVAIFLCLGVVFILMNFSTKMIKDKMHEIGILKALGTKNSSIGVVFGLQIALIAFLTCVLATAGYYVFIDLANEVLFESMKQLVPSQVVLDLDFLTFKPKVVIENCILIFALAVTSLIAPMIKIKSIKPVKIIKAKE